MWKAGRPGGIFILGKIISEQIYEGEIYASTFRVWIRLRGEFLLAIQL